MNVATVFDSSLPVSMIRRQSGMLRGGARGEVSEVGACVLWRQRAETRAPHISVLSRKLTTSASSTFTSAPITPSEVRRRYSKGFVRETVLRNG